MPAKKTTAVVETAAPKKRVAAKKSTLPARTDAQKQAVVSRGDRVIKFIEKYVIVPEGALLGKPMVLLPEQKDFIHAVYDNVLPNGKLRTRRGFFSIARKNGKTGLIAAILEAHIFGPEAKQNSDIYSAARSRDQAAIVFKYAAKSIRMNPALEGLVDIGDSYKSIKGLALGTSYKALSADAKTKHGLSPALTIHDELGQVIGPNDALYDALETAGGAQDEPLSLVISTQAASDSDLLSTLIDDALAHPENLENVVRLYAAEKDDDIFDERVWYKTNFALGKFRSYIEFAEAADRAKRMPSFEATFRNLYLNMRVSLLSLAFPPLLWKSCAGAVDYDLFTSGLPVHLALDLSQRIDLTAGVFSVQNPDDGVVHVLPFVFTPEVGIEERAKHDRADYVRWAKEGWLITTGGKVVEYAQVAEYLAKVAEGMNLWDISFDRWRIDLFKKEAIKYGLEPVSGEDGWIPVGQGYKDMSPRIETMETLLMNGKLRHGNHPLLNLGAANAIASHDPAKNRKLEKAKSSGRIDPLVAAVMSVHACAAPSEDESKDIGDNDFYILSSD